MSTYAKRGRPATDPAARFSSKLRHEGNCWFYTGARDKNTGQGKVSWNGFTLTAQRVAYEIKHGHPPRDRMRNTCGNSGCANPDHWRVGPKPAPRKRTPRDRFLGRIKKVQRVTGFTPCWEWQGYTDPNGYGKFTWPGQKGGYAHRFAFLEFVGEIFEGTEIDHLCRNTTCSNPDHLEAVSHQVNCARSPIHPFFNADIRAELRASRPRPTHCKQGHELTPDNRHPSSGRCALCARQYVAAARQKKAKDPAWVAKENARRRELRARKKQGQQVAA